MENAQSPKAKLLKLKLRKRLHAYLHVCTRSKLSYIFVPHNSDPYKSIGAILTSNNLKNVALNRFPYGNNDERIETMAFFPFTACNLMTPV